MRGSPPVQLALLLLGFFVVGIPLVQLTHGRLDSAVALPQKVMVDEARPVLVRIRYSQAPTKLEVKNGAQSLVPQGGLAPSPIEVESTFAGARQGLELSVVAEWPTGTPDTALTLEVEPDHLESRSHTLWSVHGRIEDTASFTWTP